jgi:hypothetical protein
MYRVWRRSPLQVKDRIRRPLAAAHRSAYAKSAHIRFVHLCSGRELFLGSYVFDRSRILKFPHTPGTLYRHGLLSLVSPSFLVSNRQMTLNG